MKKSKTIIAILLAAVLCAANISPALAADNGSKGSTAESTAVLGTTAEGISADGATEDGTPADGTSEDGTPADGSTEDGTPADGATEGGTSVDEATENGTPADGATEDGAPADGATEDGAPADGATEDGTPADEATADGTTDDRTSEDGTAADAVEESDGETGLISLSDCEITGIEKKTYTGKALEQNIAVNYGDILLEEGTDYAVGYENNINAGTASVTITGTGDYTGSVEKTFKIEAKKITPSVTLSAKVFVYDGSVKKPTVTVKTGSTKLAASNYSVTYASGRKNVGTYKVTVKMKGNYSGSKTVTFKINPKPTKIYNVVGSKPQFVVKWTKQTTQVTGYQIQYSLSSSFASGNKTVTISKNSINSKTIKKPKAGKTYYVRVRTYKTVSGKKYYSTWSKAVSSAVKKDLKSKQTKTLWTKGTEMAGNSNPSVLTFSFTITNRMYSAVPLKVVAQEEIYSGGIKIVLKDSKGNIWQEDYVSLKKYYTGDSYESLFYNDGGLLPPGEYTYTIKNTSDGIVKATVTCAGYSKKATTASMKSSVSARSGSWVKIGKLSDGMPIGNISYPSNGIIDGYSFEPDGSLYVWAEKKGSSSVTLKLSNGKKYTTKVNVTAGDPDFMAYVCEYKTRDNYFTVKVKNLRRSDLVIVRNGAKVEDIDYKSFDRWVKADGNVTVKYGETKYIRFYLKGSATWPNYQDYTLLAKFIFEGKTYNWHVWYNDSVFCKNNGWYNTYWDENEYGDWY